MKAFYDEALSKIALNSDTATIFSWYQSTDLHAVFMQSVHRASRPHGLFSYSAHLADILRQKMRPHAILCGLVTGQALFAGISMFI